MRTRFVSFIQVLIFNLLSLSLIFSIVIIRADFVLAQTDTEDSDSPILTPRETQVEDGDDDDDDDGAGDDGDDDQAAFSYVVQPGDNLWRIAERLGVSYQALAAQTDSPRRIYAGQVFTYSSQDLQGEQRGSGFSVTTEAVSQSGSSYTFTVRPGDTLSHIALWLGIPLEELSEQVENPRYIQPGQQFTYVREQRIDTPPLLTDNDGTDSDGIDTTGQFTDNDGIDTTGQFTDNDGTDSDGIDTDYLQRQDNQAQQNQQQQDLNTDNDGTDSDGIATSQLTDNDGTDSAMASIRHRSNDTDNDGTDSDGIDTTGQQDDTDNNDSDDRRQRHRQRRQRLNAMADSGSIPLLKPRLEPSLDPFLPELAHLFDRDWVWAAFHQHNKGNEYGRPHHFRVRQFVHRPGRTAFARYEVRWAAESYLAPRHFVARLDKDKPAEFFLYPADGRLPGLRAVADPERALDLVNEFVLTVPGRRSRVELITYRPGYRAVLRHRFGRVKLYARVARPGDLPRLLDAYEITKSSGFVVPNLAGHWEEGGVIWLSEVTGTNLRRRIRQGGMPDPMSASSWLGPVVAAAYRQPQGARLSADERVSQREAQFSASLAGFTWRYADFAGGDWRSYPLCWLMGSNCYRPQRFL